jgi:uncharacterized C2H2 Zn-finger protein
MIEDLRRIVSRATDRFTRRYWGPTFRCPVCHFLLAAVDADGNALLVCPVCGVVIEIESVYGHIVPVVHDVEVFRPQPKARVHPLATHLPIGLFPFALLGAVVLFVASLVAGWGAALGGRAPLLADATLVLLVLAVAGALPTFASGLWDWNRRYRRRPYRQITFKIAGGVVFLAVGGLAIALHASGAVFSGTTGLMQLGSPLGLLAALLYLAALGAGMLVVAVLGHVGGTLVYGR